MIVDRSLLDDFFRTLSGAFQEGLQASPRAEQADLVATTIPIGSKEWKAGWLKTFPSLRQWVGDKVIKNLAADSYSVSVDPYESTVAVDRHELEDAQNMADAVAGPSKIAKIQADAVARWKVKLIWDALAAGDATVGPDGEFFFDTTHPVAGGVDSNVDTAGGGAGDWWLMDLSHAMKPILFLDREAAHVLPPPGMDSERNYMAKKILFGIEARAATGYGFWQTAFQSDAPLTKVNLDAFWGQMGDFVDDESTPLGIVPTHLVVGNGNRALARDLIKAERDAAGATNTLFQSVELIHVPWLA
jgi:phage major head subunit gpT-like protein